MKSIKVPLKNLRLKPDRNGKCETKHWTIWKQSKIVCQIYNVPQLKTDQNQKNLEQISAWQKFREKQLLKSNSCLNGNKKKQNHKKICALKWSKLICHGTKTKRNPNKTKPKRKRNETQTSEGWHPFTWFNTRNRLKFFAIYRAHCLRSSSASAYSFC